MPQRAAKEAIDPRSRHAENAGDRLDAVFKALASAPRREILRLLASGAGEGDARCCEADEMCACVFSERLGLGAPTVSHHMKTLLDAGLVTAEKRGLWVYYRLVPEAFAPLLVEITGLRECDCAPPDRGARPT